MSYDGNDKRFGTWVQWLRRKNRLTQERLAELIDHEVSVVRKVEGHRYPSVNLDLIKKLEAHLRVPPEEHTVFEAAGLATRPENQKHEEADQIAQAPTEAEDIPHSLIEADGVPASPAMAEQIPRDQQLRRWRRWDIIAGMLLIAIVLLLVPIIMDDASPSGNTSSANGAAIDQHIDARTFWTTVADVQAGDEIHITCTATSISVGVGQREWPFISGCDGYGEEQTWSIVPKTAVGALVMRLGDDASSIDLPVGHEKTITASRSGPLQLSINDGPNRDDNAGTFDVHVTIKRAGIFQRWIQRICGWF